MGVLDEPGGAGEREAGRRRGGAHGGARVEGLLGRCDRPGDDRLAAHDGREDVGLLCRVARLGEREGHDVHGHERAGLQAAPALLGDDRGVPQAIARDAAAPVLLGYEHRVPAELGRLREVVVGDAGVRPTSAIDAIRERADGWQRATGGDELDSGLAQELLIVGQIEIHTAIAADVRAVCPAAAVSQAVAARRCCLRAWAAPTWVMTSTENAKTTTNQPKPVTPRTGA